MIASQTDRCYTLMESPFGWLGLVAGSSGLIAVTFRPEREDVLAALSEDCPLCEEGALPVLDAAAKQLREYFAGKRRSFDLPCDLSGCSDFARRVLGELAKVAYGELVSYGELARRAGAQGAARAVGRVMASNPMPLILPCHRVVAADGRLTGYSGGRGLASKSTLLEFERTHSTS